MSERPQGSVTGIFGLFFREAGLFWEQAFKWAEDQAREDRLLNADDQKRQTDNATARRAEAEARLLEQIRLAKQAGLDVDSLLASMRDERRQG
jgi:hypothetical protein